MLQVAIALDQLANTLLGGYADETLSARAWRAQHWLRYVIDAIFFFQPDHCYKAYLAELKRNQYPRHYR